MSAGNLRFKGVIAGGLAGCAIAMAAAFILPPDYSGAIIGREINSKLYISNIASPSAKKLGK